MHQKQHLSFWQIWNMCFGFMGIQFGFTLQNSNVSRIFQTLGASIDDIPVPWIAVGLLWTVTRTKEYSPAELARFAEHDKNKARDIALIKGNSSKRSTTEFRKNGALWLFINLFAAGVIYHYQFGKQTILLTEDKAGIFAFKREDTESDDTLLIVVNSSVKEARVRFETGARGRSLPD